MVSGSTFTKQSLRTGTNSPALPPECLGLYGDSRAGNKMTPLGHLVYPKGQHWNRDFPQSENRLTEPGKVVWVYCAGHSTKYQVFTKMLPSPQMPPRKQRATLVKKCCILNVLGIELSLSVFPPLRDSRKFSQEHCNILKIKLI